MLQNLSVGTKSRVGRALPEWPALDSKPKVIAPVFSIAGNLPAGLERLMCNFKSANEGTVSVTETHYQGA